MTTALALAILALFDLALAGFRAAAGRNGQLKKRAYYIRAVARAAAWACVILGAHIALVVGFTTIDASVWPRFVEAGQTLVIIYGTFAAFILGAFGFYFAPFGELRVLSTVIILGPLTLLRPVVIMGGLLAAVIRTPDPRVIAVAACIALVVLCFEPVFGRKYDAGWRSLEP